MIIIAAMGRNRVIGCGSGMPWEVPEEYQHFLETTRDQSIIIGRRSFEIFGPTLTSRHCFVVTRGKATFADAESVSTLEEGIRRANSADREVYVAGGASIYELAVPLADQMLLSYIDGNFEGDTYFPDFDLSQWNIQRRERHDRYELVDYRRH